MNYYNLRISIKTFLLLSLLVVVFSACAQSNKNSNKNVMTDIFQAIQNNDEALVLKLAADSGSREQKNSEGQTPLMYAVYQNKTAIALKLIQAGADVNAQDHIFNSPFLYAGAEGKTEIVKACLANGADFKKFNRYGGTTLIPAAEKGHLEIVKILVNTPNFPKDHINKLGWTALLEAIILSNGGPVHVQIVDELIKGGCNVNIADNNGITALQHAQKNNFKEMIALLKNAGAK